MKKDFFTTKNLLILAVIAGIVYFAFFRKDKDDEQEKEGGDDDAKATPETKTDDKESGFMSYGLGRFNTGYSTNERTKGEGIPPYHHLQARKKGLPPIQLRKKNDYSSGLLASLEGETDSDFKKRNKHHYKHYHKRPNCCSCNNGGSQGNMIVDNIGGNQGNMIVGGKGGNSTKRLVNTDKGCFSVYTDADGVENWVQVKGSPCVGGVKGTAPF